MCTDLLVELDVLHNLKCEGEVTEETVHAEKADDTEVAEELVQGASAVLSDDLTSESCCEQCHPIIIKCNSRNLLWALAFLKCYKMFVDLRLLDEGVEDIQDTVRAPDLYCGLSLLLGGILRIIIPGSHLPASPAPRLISTLPWSAIRRTTGTGK